MKQRRLLLQILVIAVIAGTFILGVFVGSRKSDMVLGSLTEQQRDDLNLDPFWKTWRVLDQKYTFDDKPTSDERLYGSISGLVDSYNDPYTTFFDPEEARAFRETISGSFSGVGMEVGIQNDLLTVVAPLRGTPADLAGILPGDVIFQINGETTIELSIDEAIQRIRGKKGTEVTLRLLREGMDEPLEVTLIRATIEVPSLETEIIDDVFVIRVFNFSLNSSELFKQAIAEFNQSDSSRLIIDLRSNPGGFLDASISMASWFLPEGKIILRESLGDTETERIYRSKGFDLLDTKADLRTVVLVNEGSASASEIFAGALQEHGRAIVVGTQTFGKGSVQELVDITSDTALKVTVAKWFTPTGQQISRNGLTPDVVMEFDHELATEQGVDSQLQEAIRLLTEVKLSDRILPI